MWDTSMIGHPITLKGCQWTLFVEAFGYAWDLVEGRLDEDADERYGEDFPWSFGVEEFDSLSRNQQLVMLATIGESLLREDVPSPKKTSLVEATLVAIISTIEDCLEIETDEERRGEPSDEEQPRRWREMVVAVYKEMVDSYDPDPEDFDEEYPYPQPPIPEPSSLADEQWREILELITDAWLGESDFDYREKIIDLSPKEVRRIQKLGRWPEGYFTAIAPDPRDSELGPIRATLAKLIGRPTT